MGAVSNLYMMEFMTVYTPLDVHLISDQSSSVRHWFFIVKLIHSVGNSKNVLSVSLNKKYPIIIISLC